MSRLVDAGQSESDVQEVRLDVWLWAARMFRTRSLAKQAVDGGKVDLNDQRCKPSRQVAIGDRLKVTRGEERLELEVLHLAAVRGPAPVAQGLYRESEASIAAREILKEQRRLEGGGLRLSARPDKRSRRQIRQFKARTEV
ncbi:RNA-binding S4 domain-containing protein [Frateuria aurantia]|uniref:Heat shock protein 15 n=1 Tax=Frateuria aurantia (strain ATCC 33424 / DSM 6220 / KCTC 2777 / LMG 1558 / NBRC 3245 / NCIMB 13370) TaxID=767434 RepID=H8L4U0_FRAAD|nr:ribosome-associated heat shock protein implicated in recycling of 50S subunit [Frateuria aurantia DSM 6220]